MSLITTEAAVLTELGGPLSVLELEVPSVGPGQVLVDVIYSGVCYTQVMEARGLRGPDPYVPHCLGHEGSGIVVQTGIGVNKVQPGDRVVLSWIKGSGSNVSGTTYRWDSRKVNAGAVTTFSRKAVVSENRVTPLPDGISMRHGALIGCAVPTGLGAVINTAAARPGQSIVVFGAGGIGLSSVAGASISGCIPIIAIDVNEDRLSLTQKMGATHLINAQKTDPVEEVKRICPEGVDVAVEATGRPDVMIQALDSVREQGGVAVIVGNAPFGAEIRLDPKKLNLGKHMKGTWGGDNWPDRDFLSYCSFVKSGKLNLDILSSQTYSLSQINAALDDLESARVPRPMIDMAA